MAYLDTGTGLVVAQASEAERVGFIRRTYLHLGGAILAFTILEALLIRSGVAESFVAMLSGSKWSWLIVMVLFMGVSYIADRWAHSAISRGMQYAGLGLFVVAEAIVFMPLIYMALKFTAATGSNVLLSAGLMTLMLAGGITFTAFSTKKNFSFLAPFITVGGFVALGLILASIIFGFSLGLVFFGAMVIFAGVVMLYQTSQIIHEYNSEQYVAASLGLFSSVALIFWYMVQFLMSLGNSE